MLAAISVFPTDKGESVSAHVKKAVEVIAHSGLDYRVTAMGTLVEGEAHEIFALLAACHAAVAADSDRVYMTVSIDDRRGATGRLSGKIDSLEQKLGHPVRR